jgi:pyruvate-formate lyase
MTTKEYLSQISRLDRMIKNKLSEISQLREVALSISSVQNEERVQSTPNFDKIGNACAKIDEMERNLDKMIDEYLQKKNTIISQIDSMENEIYYDVLFSRYIEKKTFEKIAADMNYSFRNVTRLHWKALNEFEKKYGEQYLKLS